ncbi:hypothetical protein GCM10009801_01540 [Streptomyces albiaxialis]|uniref:Lipoprotein n=1 Tax=Streptomyces albiaxialis TaxID=329523 RepID=A0ABN2VED7_9ACTN
MRIKACLPGLALALSLTLTGCGIVGGDEDGGDGTQKTSSSSSPSRKPVPTPPGAAKEPGFDLPDDVYVVIANELTGNKEKDAVLRDHSRATMARVLAYAKATTKHSKITEYRQDDALETLREDVRTYRREVLVARGVYRYYKRELTMKGPADATVRFCESRREAFDKSLATGKSLRTRPSLKDFTRIEDVLHKRDGTWRVISTRTEEGVKDCRR